MLLERKLLLEPRGDIPWEFHGVFNPTVIKEKGVIHLIYKAEGGDNCSSLGYAKIEKGSIKRSNSPLLKPEKSNGEEGIEDPHITKIDGEYHLLYITYDGKNARIALSISKNSKQFDKVGIVSDKFGIVSPNMPTYKAVELVGSEKYRKVWNRIWPEQIMNKEPDHILYDKDAILFPRKFNGKYAMLHRLEPDVQIVLFERFSDLQDNKFWEDYLKNIESNVVMRQKYDWESEKIGGGTTPIETKKGWLLLYHGVENNNDGNGLIYRVGVSLLDLENPKKEISRLPYPLFGPEYSWEKEVNGNKSVVFPTGSFVEYDPLKGCNFLNLVYGCADKRIAMTKVNLEELLDRLEENKAIN